MTSTWWRKNLTSPAGICGHRGTPVHAPENTLAGFIRAGELGATSIEFDVRPTRDGVFVVHHDPSTADGTVICETDQRDLDPAIPTLAAVAQTCPHLGFDIELKTDETGLEPDVYAAQALQHIESCCADRADEVLITSFDHTVLNAVASGPFATGLLFWQHISAAQAIERAVKDGHDAIVPWIPLLSAQVVNDARAVGLAVLTWTVNTVEHVQAAIAADVDVIIGDDPALLCETVRSRS